MLRATIGLHANLIKAKQKSPDNSNIYHKCNKIRLLERSYKIGKEKPENWNSEENPHGLDSHEKLGTILKNSAILINRKRINAVLGDTTTVGSTTSENR